MNIDFTKIDKSDFECIQKQASSSKALMISRKKSRSNCIRESGMAVAFSSLVKMTKALHVSMLASGTETRRLETVTRFTLMAASTEATS